ncbi:ABC transporter substrate-binding protein [Paracoccus aestuariivivens]|uniref:Extracellular solute-binding protein n=1 Tax=Paracoccus aestuariivivens TaxID=1820333 RepID=A0A6L6J8P0_9RHOB|nr:extracellular solute-binding protein [Paracoccus aestuariivivens]MTH78523.1 extracellular solute-binding protein [Paracoccus aestuariivivens]
MSYLGLTWDHPRGRHALEAAARQGGPVRWEVQPLEGFESAPIAENCARYDLVVLDHPHLGEALAADCLRPLDEIFSPDELRAIADRAIGPSMESYVMAGRVWALPLDAATQVMAWRPDLLEQAPVTWDEVATLSRRTGRVALSLAGPHAWLSFLSVCHAIRPDLDLREGDTSVPRAVAIRALTILADLAQRSPASVLGKNPIGILEHMSGGHDDVALCPLVYGYVNYAAPSRSVPLRFANAPRIAAGQPPGSILGGTGIAVSRRAQVDEALRAHLLWLLGPEAQQGFIPAHDGQPGTRAAWHDPAVNAACGNFFSDTAETLEAASIRPRHDGGIAYQTAASAAIRAGFAAGTDPANLADELEAMFQTLRHPIKEPQP